MQEVLDDWGVEFRRGSPRAVLEATLSANLVPDSAVWLRLFEQRNLAIHTYNPAIADEFTDDLPDYLEVFSQLDSTLKELGFLAEEAL